MSNVWLTRLLGFFLTLNLVLFKVFLTALFAEADFRGFRQVRRFRCFGNFRKVGKTWGFEVSWNFLDNFRLFV